MLKKNRLVSDYRKQPFFKHNNIRILNFYVNDIGQGGYW